MKNAQDCPKVQHSFKEEKWEWGEVKKKKKMEYEKEEKEIRCGLERGNCMGQSGACM